MNYTRQQGAFQLFALLRYLGRVILGILFLLLLTACSMLRTEGEIFLLPGLIENLPPISTPAAPSSTPAGLLPNLQPSLLRQHYCQLLRKHLPPPQPLRQRQPPPPWRSSSYQSSTWKMCAACNRSGQFPRQAPTESRPRDLLFHPMGACWPWMAAYPSAYGISAKAE